MLHYCTGDVDAGHLDLSAAAVVGGWERGVEKEEEVEESDSAAQTLGLQTSFA